MISKDELIDASKEHCIILYDGDCILCSNSILWIIKKDKDDLFRYCPLQKVEGFVSSSDISTVVLIDNGNEFYKSDVTFKILEKFGGFWRLLLSLRLVPRFIRDSIYDLIAKNRYNWFGKKENCLIPTEEIRAKFLSI